MPEEALDVGSEVRDLLLSEFEKMVLIFLLVWVLKIVFINDQLRQRFIFGELMKQLGEALYSQIAST